MNVLEINFENYINNVSKLEFTYQAIQNQEFKKLIEQFKQFLSKNSWFDTSNSIETIKELITLLSTNKLEYLSKEAKKQ